MMRRKTAIISMMILLSIIFVSCKQYNSNQSGTSDIEELNNTPESEAVHLVRIYDFSDSITSADHKIEYEFADREKYETTKPLTTINDLIDGKSYKGTLQSTQYRAYNYFPVYSYLDSEGVSLEYDDEGKLVGYFCSRSDEDKILSKEDCTEIAVNFMKNIIDISSYTVTVEDDSEKEVYIVDFQKYIGDIKTTETATVKVQYNGNIYSYSSFMLGRIASNVKIDNVNSNDIISSVNKKLDSIYSDSKNYYSRIEYEKSDLKLTVLKDGSIAFICYVDVNCIRTQGEYDVIDSERICFVVNAE